MFHCPQMKPGCRVAHLFTIALMELNEWMRLALSPLAENNYCSVLERPAELSRRSEEVNYVDDGDLLTYQSEAVSAFRWFIVLILLD